MTKSVKILKLSKLTPEAKEAIYCRLLKKSDYTCNMDLFGKDGRKLTVDVNFFNNDLCVNSFYHNFYFRTEKATKNLRYSTFSAAIRELKKLLNHNMDLQSYSNLRIYCYNKKYDAINIFNIEL